ncbi:hypothetical protein [Rhodoferax sp. BLA1]|nr:hypothetical protein [Rhodoferax sp. BLA1]
MTTPPTTDTRPAQAARAANFLELHPNSTAQQPSPTYSQTLEAPV